MATNDNLQVISLEAGADLSAKQYYFVTVAADGQVDPTGDGLAADGVVQNDPAAAGRAATVGVSGRTKVVAGGVVTAGDEVASDTSGRAVTAATGDIILGRALSTSANAGEIISIIFNPRGAAA